MEGECSGVIHECQLLPVRSSPEIDATIDLALASTFDWIKEGKLLDAFVKDSF